MGLASRPGRRSPKGDTAAKLGVTDVIEMKESLGLRHAPGVVAVLDDYHPDDPHGLVGRVVRVESPSRGEMLVPTEAVRDHGSTVSVFLRGLTPADVAVGATVEIR